MEMQLDTSECQGTDAQSSMRTEVQKPGDTDQSSNITGNKYYIHIPEKTFKCHEDIIRKFQQISGLEEVKSVEECHFLVVLCTIVSRAGTDIEAALNELNKLSEYKPAIFMVLHHTFDREKTVPNSSRSVNRENTLTVDLLFYEDEGLLECMKNNEALDRIQKWLPPEIQEQAFWLPSIFYNLFCWPHVVSDAKAEEVKVGETEDKQETILLEEIDVLQEDKDQTVALELLIVLLGMSGSGKSAAKSMMFGRDEKSQAGVSTATQITRERGRLHKDQVSVLDTPDWFSSGVPMEQIKQNIQLIRMCSSGPYAFLLVIPLKNEFTEKEREMVKNMEIFEEISWERVMILFIITDEKENQNIDKNNFLQHQNHQELVKKCGERFHLFDFSQIRNKAQVQELLKKIKKMVGGNREISDEREINYIQKPLPKSQRTVWISECQKIKQTPEVHNNLKQRLTENSETCDSFNGFELLDFTE